MHNNLYDNDSNIYVLQLKEERLNIDKKIINSGDFKIYKETSIKEKTFKIPITHVDLVIEPQSTDDPKINKIKIPLMEEKIEFNKSFIQLEDIKIYKHTFEDIVPIEITLKKENLNISNIGDVNIVNKL